MAQEGDCYALFRDPCVTRNSLLCIMPSTVTKERIRDIIWQQYVPDFFKPLAYIREDSAKDGEVFRFTVSATFADKATFTVIHVHTLV